MSGKWRIFASTGTALGFGTLAAAIGACCVAPWAVALLGVTGAVAMARLAFLQPVFIVGSVISLAFAFWSAYRKPAACADGTCVTDNRRRLRVLVWIALGGLCALAALTFLPVFSELG